MGRLIIKYSAVILVFILSSCQRFLKENRFQNKIFKTDNSKYYTEGNDFVFLLENKLKTKIRASLQADNPALNSKLRVYEEVVLNTFERKKIKINRTNFNEKELKSIYIKYKIGDLKSEIKKIEFILPFQKNKVYTVLQAYAGDYSHGLNAYSRYSIDFNLTLNDTICASSNGVVVALVEKYKKGADIRNLESKTNYMLIFHPKYNVYTHYANFKYRGSLVSIGDEVSEGQTIALSGKTGRLEIPQLHFSLMIPEDSKRGLKSIPILFKGNLKGSDLRSGTMVRRE